MEKKVARRGWLGRGQRTWHELGRVFAAITCRAGFSRVFLFSFAGFSFLKQWIGIYYVCEVIYIDIYTYIYIMCQYIDIFRMFKSLKCVSDLKSDLYYWLSKDDLQWFFLSTYAFCFFLLKQAIYIYIFIYIIYICASYNSNMSK